MKPSANTPSLSTVLTEFKKFKVEDYQRTYSWGKEQIVQMFLDLDECIQTGETHFFGTLILESSRTEESTAAVVDGQQRLTTIFILLAAIRDEISKLSVQQIGDNDPNRMPITPKDKVWKILYYSNAFTAFRFTSNRFLQEMLQNSVLAEPNSQQKLPSNDSPITLPFRKAVKTIRHEMSQRVEQIGTDIEDQQKDLAKLEYLNTFLDVILDRLIILKVITNSQAESLDIFLTLNNRGLPLGPSDLVRGLIMSERAAGKSEGEQKKIFKNNFEEWKQLTDQVGDPETFLRHFLVATSSEKVQKKKVLDKVRERIRPTATQTASQLAESFWKDLSRGAQVYERIITPTEGSQGDNKIDANSVYRLQLLEGLSRSHRIFLLRALDVSMSDTSRNELVRLTSTLSFRWVMAGLNAQQLEDFYQKCANMLDEGSSADLVGQKIKERISEIHLDALAFLKSEGDSHYLVKALLHALNRSLVKGAQIVPLDSKIHLEHIAPRSSNGTNWVEYLLGDSGDENSYAELVSEAGNLTLLDEKLNVSAQQKPFEEKKKSFYDKTTLKITNDLQNLPLWSARDIEMRNIWLAEMFELIWAVEPGTPATKHYTEWKRIMGN